MPEVLRATLFVQYGENTVQVIPPVISSPDGIRRMNPESFITLGRTLAQTHEWVAHAAEMTPLDENGETECDESKTFLYVCLQNKSGAWIIGNEFSRNSSGIITESDTLTCDWVDASSQEKRYHGFYKA